MKIGTAQTEILKNQVSVAVAIKAGIAQSVPPFLDMKKDIVALAEFFASPSIGIDEESKKALSSLVARLQTKMDHSEAAVAAFLKKHGGENPPAPPAV